MMKLATTVLCLAIGAATMLGVVEVGRADTPMLAVTPGVTVIAPMVDAGSDQGSSATPAPPTAAQPAAVSTDPQLSDVSLLSKLWKNKSFLSIAIVAFYLGLFAWGKLDKKHAFYASTALAGVVILVDSIRTGNTPNLDAITHALGPTIGLLIAGPNHVKA